MTSTKAPQAEVQLPLPVSTTTAGESDEENCDSGGEDAYESLDKYRLPPPPPNNTILTKSVITPLPSTPPPLPRRGKSAEAQFRIDQLYRRTNDLLMMLHEIYKNDESITSTKNENNPAAKVLNNLIDVADLGETEHFDSIPVPKYPSPEPPRQKPTEYLQPVSKPSPLATTSIPDEPVYAQVVKKLGSKPETNSNAITDLSRKESGADETIPPPIPPKIELE